MKNTNINKIYEIEFQNKKYNLKSIQLFANDLVEYAIYVENLSNTTISKNLVFEIPAQLQNKIDYIVFNGVILEFSKANIKVKIQNR